jgi:hypothetical protein
MFTMQAMNIRFTHCGAIYYLLYINNQLCNLIYQQLLIYLIANISLYNLLITIYKIFIELDEILTCRYLTCRDFVFRILNLSISFPSRDFCNFASGLCGVGLLLVIQTLKNR